MLRVFNDTARYVDQASAPDRVQLMLMIYIFPKKWFNPFLEHVPNVRHQGGGKRKGSFAVYLEPWHADIFAFLDLK